MCHRITLSHTHTSCMDAEFSGGSSPHMKSRRRVNLLQGDPRIPCKSRRSSFERPLPAGVGSVTNGDRRVSIVHQTPPWAESQRGRNREIPATHAVNTPPLSFLAAAAAAAQGAEALTLGGNSILCLHIWSKYSQNEGLPAICEFARQFRAGRKQFRN